MRSFFSKRANWSWRLFVQTISLTTLLLGIGIGLFVPVVQVQAQTDADIAAMRARGASDSDIEAAITSRLGGGSTERGVGGFVGGSALNVVQWMGERMYGEGNYQMNSTAENLRRDASMSWWGETATRRGEVTRTNVATGQTTGDINNTSVTASTGAGSIVDQLTARLVGFIAFMMGLIVSFLGKMILLLVNVLLGFLTYNSFADAPPVVVGWKMVRDVANMFFIVIMIASAYGTILGRKDMHVREIVPKVILAAVLVNFSKTIVSLLIDASQVVMLTFVNAFASIGAGNFTNALHIPLITQASYAGDVSAAVSSAGTAISNAGDAAASQVATNGAGQVILDVVLASALQIFLLVVAIGVLLMMIVFVAARIIGLWMLLVFSPMPFLADALPASMKKMLGGQVNEYWPRLTGLLTGGPIMAFWLWLTFATLAGQGADERLGLFQNTQATDLGTVFNTGQNAVSFFITRIGNAQGLGSYLIAVAMMLMGLEAASDAASSMSKVVAPAGDLMKKIKGKTQTWAQQAALYGAGGGVLAGGALAVGAMDKRYDFRRYAAGAARSLPFAGQNKWLREQQFKNRKDALDRAKSMESNVNNELATEKEKDKERGINRGAFGWRTYDPAVGIAERRELAKRAADPKGYDDELKDAKDANKKLIAGRTDDVVGKLVSDQMAKEQGMARRIEDLKAQQAKIPVRMGDDGRLKGGTAAEREEYNKIDDMLKKLNKENPQFIQDAEERNKQLKQTRQNWKSLDQETRSNFEVLRHVATEGAFKEVNGRLQIGDKNAINDTRSRLSGKDLSNFNALVQQVERGGEFDPKTNKFVNNGLDLMRLRNMSVVQDASFKDHVFEAMKNGDGTLNSAMTGYVQSDQDKYVLGQVSSALTEGNTADWLKRSPSGMPIINGNPGTLAAGAEQKLVYAAATTGIAQAVNAVGSSNPATAAPLRQAAMNTVLSNLEREMNGVGTKLSTAVPYPDGAGGTVSKTPKDAFRDSTLPLSTKTAIKEQYQKDMTNVVLSLQGADELNFDQQVALMGAIARGNVAGSIDEQLMSPEQRRILGEAREMMINNSEDIDRWFQSVDSAELSKMEAFDAMTDVNARNTLLKDPANAAIRQKYQVYSNYRDARSAIAQFDKGGGSSQGRKRKGGGKGKGKKGKGGGGKGSPTPPVPPAPAGGGGGGAGGGT